MRTWMVLSVRQPWAWLLTQGVKGVENRTWPTRFRGPVLIHAGRQAAPKREQLTAMRLARWPAGVDLPAPRDWERGGIVGVARLADVVMDAHQVTEAQIAVASRVGMARVFRAEDWEEWPEVTRWFFGPFGFVLEDATALPFEALPGRLGLFEAGYGGRCCQSPGLPRGAWTWCAVCGRVNGWICERDRG